LLVGNDARDGGDDVHDFRWVVPVDAENPQTFDGVLQVRFGVLFGGFGLFQRALGNSAFFIKNLGPLELHSGQPLIVYSL